MKTDTMPKTKYPVIRRALKTLKDTDQGLYVERKDLSWREYQIFQILQPYYKKATQPRLARGEN